MKHLIINIYIIVSVAALSIVYNDLKEVSEKLEVLTEVVTYHQKALESHKVVIETHDTAIGLVFDHFENTFL